uniref:hypothetical protein n=1 Tax=Paludisphaera sp. TaxID=2017432 RepID=UPI00301C105D
MIAAWLLGGALCLATGDDGAGPPGPDRAAYEAAAAAAGRDAPAHVDLALWCEARGMAAEKARHLARAVLLDPDDQRARGLLGQVRRDGRWMRPADVARSVEESPDQKALLDEYFERRAGAADKADDQYRLALWCEEKGLAEPMVAHLRRTLQLDPGREGAWRRLGFRKVGNRWINPEVEAAIKADREDRARADKEWAPRLEKLRDGLASRDKAKRSEALAALAEIDDPRASLSVWKVFGKGGDLARQRVAVDIFSRIEGPEASTALATLAVFSPHAAIRADAAALLQRRDPREFAGMLAGLIRKEERYRVKPVEGPGSRGELVVEGETANVTRLYSPLQNPVFSPWDSLQTDAYGRMTAVRHLGDAFGPRTPLSLFRGTLPYIGKEPDAYGIPVVGVFSSSIPDQTARLPGVMLSNGLPPDAARLVAGLASSARPDITPATHFNATPVYGVYLTIPVERMIAEARASVAIARQRQAEDVAAIEARNASIREVNDRAVAILSGVSGQAFGDDAEKWSRWVYDLEGYGFPLRSESQPPPTFVEEVPLGFQPQAFPTLQANLVGLSNVGPSCFAGGTLVRTLQGDRPIESIRPGDLVLSQDVTTGRLAFKAVVEAFHNPPNLTYD